MKYTPPAPVDRLTPRQFRFGPKARRADPLLKQFTLPQRARVRQPMPTRPSATTKPTERTSSHGR